MGTLFRYELKKLLNRKLVWLLFALCTALLLWNNWNILEERWSGRAQGFRDIYSLYEGRTVTEAFKQEAKADYMEYIAANPDDFEAVQFEGEDSVTWFPRGGGYYDGVWHAFEDITNSNSLENRQEYVETVKKWLAGGVYDDGKKLTDADRRYYGEAVAAGVTVPVIRYAQGWRELLSKDSPLPAFCALFLLGIALLPLFAGERSAKMESVLLCAKKRGNAAFAKMLAAFTIACAAAAFFFCIEIAFTLYAYGADGAALTRSIVEWYNTSNQPIGAAFALYILSVVLAACSIAALAALAGALIRHPVLALLATGTFIIVQILPTLVLFDGSSWWYDSPFWSAVEDFFRRLPTSLLLNRYVVMNSVSELQYAPYAFGLPALISGLLFLLVPRVFVKRRMV